MTALLEARNVSKVFGGGLLSKSQSVALENFSFSISGAVPSITAIVGESGSGKTTLVRLLLGLAAPTTGEVFYKGKDLQTLSQKERRAYLGDVQAIFQDPFEVYNPFYKIDHVLETPIRNFKLAKGKNDRRQLMEQVLSEVGLRPEETLGRYPHQLSGGQRQRIMVARALLLRPRLIIADEPVSMVDASLRATILESLLKLNREFGISLIYITHDLTTAYQVSENILVLYRGSIAEAGEVQRVVHEPEHPYTRLLVGSIPLPDPDRAWQGEHVLEGATGKFKPEGDSYCKFCGRCPAAMQICVEDAPPMFKTDPHRVTACYLYRKSPVLESEEITSIFAASPNEHHQPPPPA
jgi:peptide/nickel transport system ATP-binding protein